MYLTKRQREILFFLRDFLLRHGYAPSLEEIAAYFGLRSVATVHKHLENLEAKGLIRRFWNRKRAIELLDAARQIPGFAQRLPGSSLSVPLLGVIVAGMRIEPALDAEVLDVPESFLGHGETYALLVRGDSMEDEGILDGDYIIVERRESAQDGEIVVALLGDGGATLKKYYREGSRIRLQPANRSMPPIMVDEGDLRIQGVVIGLLRKFR